MKQRMALFGMVTVALIFAACGGDSGNNGTELEESSSSSAISSSSAKVQSSSSVPVSSSSVNLSSSSFAISSSSAKVQSSSSVPVSSSSVNLSSSSFAISSSSAKVQSSSSVPVSSSSVNLSSSSFAISSSSAKLQSSSSVPVSSSSVNLSSSSFAVSSSSAKVQSSSSSVPSSSSALDPSSVEYGSFSYGGQTYKTVKIGTQTWMAENLNYADSAAMTNLKGNSWCYENSADSCAKYGRLYTWTAAMNLASSYQSASATTVISTPHQGVCPTGWHIPRDADWTTLENAVGGDAAGTALKSKNGWNATYGVSGNGTDAYGFSALAGGYYNGSAFGNVGNLGYWWTAQEIDFTEGFGRGVLKNVGGLLLYYFNKTYGRSIRCLKD